MWKMFRRIFIFFWFSQTIENHKIRSIQKFLKISTSLQWCLFQICKINMTVVGWFILSTCIKKKATSCIQTFDVFSIRLSFRSRFIYCQDGHYCKELSLGLNHLNDGIDRRRVSLQEEDHPGNDLFSFLVFHVCVPDCYRNGSGACPYLWVHEEIV